MKKVREFTALEAAWLAAVIDGEGSIGLYKGFEGRFVIIQIGNTNNDFVQEVRRIIGCGSKVRRNKFGKSHKGRKPMYYYSLKGSARCLRVLVQIAKYLIIKKEKARHVIYEIKSKPFGAWTKARKAAQSKRSKLSWKNPAIRAKRIKGIREAANA